MSCRLARKIVGLSLMAACLSYFVAHLALFWVQGPGSFLAVVAIHLSAWYVSHAALCTATVLVVPAVLGITLLLRGAAPAYGLAGGTLALFGILASTATETFAFVVGQIARTNLHAAIEGLLAGRLGVVLASLEYLSFPLLSLGLAVLTLGLYRARGASRKPAILLVTGAVLALLPLPIPIGAFCIAVGVGWLGVATLAAGNEAHTPQRAS